MSSALPESHRQEKCDSVLAAMKSYSDFPKPGILFYDIFPVLANHAAFSTLIDLFLDSIGRVSCDVIVGLDARGFLFGPILALQLQKPFVPVRKSGKLPGKCEEVTYKLEYGQDTFQMQCDSIVKGQRVVIIDDLLATGGTMSAACELVNKIGGIVTKAIVVVELSDLGGRSKVSDPLDSFIKL